MPEPNKCAPAKPSGRATGSNDKVTGVVTLTLIAFTVACWALTAVLGQTTSEEMTRLFSFEPQALSKALKGPLAERAYIHGLWKAGTSMFVHEYDPMHVLSNMAILLLFGRAVEKRLGTVRYLSLYLFTGILTAEIYWFIAPQGKAMYGASAAVCGVSGAYAALFFSKHPIWSLLALGLFAANFYLAANPQLAPQAGFTF